MFRRSFTFLLIFSFLFALTGCGAALWGQETSNRPPQAQYEQSITIIAPTDYMDYTQNDSILHEPLRGKITGDNLRVRETPGDGEVLGHLNIGDLVEIIGITHVDDAIWCNIGWGWISLQYIYLIDFNIQGGIMAFFPEGVYLLEFPGSQYSGTTRLSHDGYLCIWQMVTIDDTVWGMTDSGWVDMGYATVPGNAKVYLGTVFEQEEVTEPTEPIPTETNPKPENTVKPTPNNTPLVGDWTQFSPSDFISGGFITTQHWVFYADGTFNTSDCEYIYFPDQDGLYGASGGWSESGVYTYDGNTLVLYYQSHFSDDPDDCGSLNKVESYTGKISNDIVNFGSFTLCRGSDVNQWICTTIKQNAGLGGSQLVSVWHNSERSYSFYSDGTYEESSAQGNHQGHYACINDKLYLVYNKNHFELFLFRVSGDTLTTEAMAYYGTETQEYNRGNE